MKSSWQLFNDYIYTYVHGQKLKALCGVFFFFWNIDNFETVPMGILMYQWCNCFVSSANPKFCMYCIDNSLLVKCQQVQYIIKQVIWNPKKYMVCNNYPSDTKIFKECRIASLLQLRERLGLTRASKLVFCYRILNTDELH